MSYLTILGTTTLWVGATRLLAIRGFFQSPKCCCILIVNTSQNELSKVEKSELVTFSVNGLLAKSMVALRSFLRLKYVFEKLFNGSKCHDGIQLSRFQILLLGNRLA
jgi:hypothetical protein